MSRLHISLGKQTNDTIENNPQSTARIYALQEMLEKFNETGNKLESRYKDLLKETECLRAQLRAKDIEIKRAEKLALLGETAAAIAHEVRNPLGAMKLFLTLLKRDIIDRPDALDLVQQIERGMESIEHVVSNILQFARQGQMSVGPVNIHAIIQEQLALVRCASNDRLRIDAELNGNPYLYGNEQGLRQVVYNLLTNAMQATRQVGSIVVTTNDIDSNSIILTVSDSGPGIPEELIEKVFDPFVTTKSEGTGLGLAIVKQIVSHHGGTIAACNCGGARFTITLPRQGSQDRTENIKGDN